jgi:pimeloyl-ACP methyl ester carboxylesterase
LTIQANGAAFHVARTGTGQPLLLLHGWPEFWLSWEPVMTRLSDRFTLYAPDLRGFGDSDKPAGPHGPDQHAADMLALMDALGLEQAGIVGHDVGGGLMQPLARAAPARIKGLFFFDFLYPGIGPRMAEPDRLNNIWYQSFNQLEIAPTLVGASRESCRAYIGYFLKHWSHRKDAFDERVRGIRRQLPETRQPRRRLCLLSRSTCGTGPDAEGRSTATGANRPADLRSLGGARSAVSLCLDRSARRNFFESRSFDAWRRRTLCASRGSRPRGFRDRGVLQTRRLELIGIKA